MRIVFTSLSILLLSTINSAPTDSPSYFTSSDNMQIFYKTWNPPTNTPTIGRVLAVHGLGEYIERYDHIFTNMANNGLQVLGMDLRGHGKTFLRQETMSRSHPVQRGYLTFSQTFEDLDILSALDPANSTEVTPTFLFGSSMGGLLMLSKAFKDRDSKKWAGVLAQAPAIGTVSPIPQFVYHLFMLQDYIPSLGRYTKHSNLDTSDLTPAEIHDITTNPNLHRKISLALARDIVRAGDELKEKASVFNTPFMFAQNVGDKVTSYVENNAWMEASGSTDKEFVKFTGPMRHSIHLVESIKETLTEVYTQWILKRIVVQ